MIIMKRKKSSIIAIFILFSFSISALAVPVPVGFGGRVIVNDNYTNGLTITITNTNTGETKTAITQGGSSGDGFFACALSYINDGDIIQISCEYNGKVYTNTTTAHVNLITNWINLTIDDNDTPVDHKPVADFFFIPSDPETGEEVLFTSTSSDEDNDIEIIKWTTGGTIKYGGSVNHIFNLDGNYMVTLTVMDTKGNTDSESKMVSVITPNDNGNDDIPPVDHKPVADFFFIPSDPETGEEVLFTSTSSDEDNDIENFTWSIDTINKYGNSISYIFNSAGNYTVALTIADGAGNTDIMSKIVPVVDIETNVTDNVNDTDEDLETNITLFIKVNDENNDPIFNVPITITRDNNTETVHTNRSGIAVFHTTSGGCSICAYYGDRDETKHMSFSHDGIVTFSFPVNNLNSHEQAGFPWLVAMIFIIVVIGIAGVICWAKVNYYWG